MAFVPSFVAFSASTTFDQVQINLVNAETDESLAGAFLGVPPLVDGKYVIDLALNGLTPETYPALAGISLKAKLSLKLGSLSSAPAYSSPFTFALPSPFDIVVG